MSITLYEDNISLNEIKLIKGKISLGLCCINNSLNELKKENRIYCNRTMIRKNFSVEKAKEYALKNVQDISKLIEWNEKHNIKHLRLSSDMFPHYTDEVTEKYTLDFAKDELKKAGKLAKKYGHRITFHPGQFCVVGAKDENVFEKTIKDLEMHADILDLMEIDMDGILCIHGGGIYGDKPSAINRWCNNFLQLPEKIKRRLCIENCEHSYNIEDCLEISKRCNIPVILDSHHYQCYNILHPDNQINNIENYMEDVIKSWGERTPLFHISEQNYSKRIGAHSTLCQHIPRYILEVPIKYNKCISIEVEAKGKEAAIFYLMKKYPIF